MCVAKGHTLGIQDQSSCGAVEDITHLLNSCSSHASLSGRLSRLHSADPEAIEWLKPVMTFSHLSFIIFCFLLIHLCFISLLYILYFQLFSIFIVSFVHFFNKNCPCKQMQTSTERHFMALLFVFPKRTQPTLSAF